MAGPVYVYKRLWNPEIVIDANSVLNRSSRQEYHGKNNTPVYHIKWHGTSQGGEELGTAADSAKNGVTTPFQIWVVSSDVGDNRSTGAGFVHSVALVGISVASVLDYQNGKETPKTSVEVIAMNGTTDVTSTRYYLWVDHAYACEWGTGATHDAEGDITIESPANTDLLTIKATYNESNGGIIHFKDGDTAKIHHVRIAPTATLAAGDGATVTAGWTGMDKPLNDANVVDIVDTYTYIHYGGEYREHGMDDFSRYASNAGQVLFSETLIANGQPLEIDVILELNSRTIYPVGADGTSSNT